jgi:hypothetical protein
MERSAWCALDLLGVFFYYNWETVLLRIGERMRGENYVRTGGGHRAWGSYSSG